MIRPRRPASLSSAAASPPAGRRLRIRSLGVRPLPALSLVLSSATLLCCALPALLVLLGAGSVLATLLSWLPALVLLSEQKLVVFALAALALVLAGVGLGQAAGRPCPRDPRLAHRCRRQLRQARWLYGVSCIAYGIGFFVAFLLPRLSG
ncbi:MAG: hypothetical protein ACKOXO_06025 [Cyanobium sp.]